MSGLKQIKGYQWVIGIALVTFIVYVVSRTKFTQINGVKLSEKDVKPIDSANDEAYIKRLHPKFRNLARALINRVEDKLGLKMFITSGYRTYEEQARLHAQNPNNAKPGVSSHNFGFAFDVNVRNKQGDLILTKSSSSKKWKDAGVVDVAKELGMLWGGDGLFGNYHDPVHFFIKPNGKSTVNLAALKEKGKVDSNGYIIV
jgi:hypothetical protein